MVDVAVCLIGIFIQALVWVMSHPGESLVGLGAVGAALVLVLRKPQTA